MMDAWLSFAAGFSPPSLAPPPHSASLPALTALRMHGQQAGRVGTVVSSQCAFSNRNCHALGPVCLLPALPAMQVTRNATPSKISKVAPSSIYEVSKPVLSDVPKLSPDDSGIVWLEDYDGLFVTQRLDVLQASIQYSIAPIVRGAELPEELSSAYTYPLRAALEEMHVLRAREVSTRCQRTCCPLYREFQMDFKDSNYNGYFSIERPFVFELCCCWPMAFLRSQNLSITDKVSNFQHALRKARYLLLLTVLFWPLVCVRSSSQDGKVISKAFEPVGCFEACWTRTFVVMDEKARHVYTLKASDCGTQSGCNFCAPSPCNETYDVEVYTPDGSYLNSSSFVYPGCACGMLADRSNLVVRFPADATAAQRAGLFGGLMLVEYTAMELVRLKEGSGSSGGGGKGGGAPESIEMER